MRAKVTVKDGVARFKGASIYEGGSFPFFLDVGGCKYKFERTSPDDPGVADCGPGGD